MFIGDYMFEPYQRHYKRHYRSVSIEKRGSIEIWLVRLDGYELGQVHACLEGYLVSPLVEYMANWLHNVYYDIDKVFKTKLDAAQFLHAYSKFD